MTIYVSKSGQRYGPYTVEELRAAVLSGMFGLEQFASCDNGVTWIPISAVPGIGSCTYMVESDHQAGLLVIRYRGRVGPGDVERCAEEVAEALAGMAPGFRLLADFTALEAMDVACAAPLKKIMHLCNAKGVRAVARVMPDPRRDIGLKTMSYFHYGPAVQIFTCKNLDEANAALAGIADNAAGVVVPLDARNE